MLPAIDLGDYLIDDPGIGTLGSSGQGSNGSWAILAIQLRETD
jgi:hypothetical protein